MALKVGALYATVELDRKPFQAHLTAAHGEFRNFGQGILGEAVGLGARLLPALAIGVAVKKIGEIGIAYQDSMNTFQAVSGATAAQMDKVGKKAQELGNDLQLPNVSASDAAVAMTELAKGGLDVEQSMGAAKGVLQLSAAAETDVATAANLTATALNAFHLSGDKAVMVADLLAGGANASGASVTDMGFAFQMSASSASALKIPIQDLSTMIAEMANSGIKGSDAGTSLKTMLTALATPTKQATAEMKALGVAAFDSHGNIKPMPELIGQFQRGLEKLSPQQKLAALNTIFGSDAQRAGNVIFGQSVKTYEDLYKGVTKQGAAAEVAAAKAKGLGGAWRGFQSELETTALEIYNGAAPALEWLVRWAAENFPKAIEGAKAAIREIVRVAGPWVDAFKNNLVPALHNSEDSMKSLTSITDDMRAGILRFVRSPEFASLVAGFVVYLPIAVQASIAALALFGDQLRLTLTLAAGVVKVSLDIMRQDWKAAWTDMTDTAKLEAENVTRVQKDAAAMDKAIAKGMSQDTVAEFENMKARVLNTTNAQSADLLSATQHQSAVLAHEYRNSGMTSNEQLAEGLRQSKDAPIGAETETVRAAIAAGRQEASGAATIGSMLSQGIALGIIQSGGVVDAAARAQIRNAKAEMQAAARQGSPSRLFAEEVGRPISEGVAMGIEQASHLPARAAARLIEKAARMRAVLGGLSATGAAGGNQTTVHAPINVYGETNPRALARELAYRLA